MVASSGAVEFVNDDKMNPVGDPLSTDLGQHENRNNYVIIILTLIA